MSKQTTVIKLIHKESGSSLGEITLADGITPSDFGQCVANKTVIAKSDRVEVEVDPDKVVPVKQTKTVK